MKLKHYLKDKTYAIIILLLTYIILLLLLLTFKINTYLIISIFIILTLTLTIIFLYSYYRKKEFYEKLLQNVKRLDQSYLVLETLAEPNFYEGKILFETLYEINKSMIENVKNYQLQVKDFKEYIEMWIHEVKAPLSSLILLTHNHKDKVNSSALQEMNKIDNYLEQILYYIRSENANKDYLINKVNLEECVKKVALRNKDYLLESNINLEVKNLKHEIYTDSKWLEFILNQIINNSIKYKDDKKESYIKIYSTKSKESITLFIEDNGIGIETSDLKRVFDKSFTGKNGRKNLKSTGMGLFIAKSLCDKLGHKINIESISKKYTKVSITISTNKYFEVVK